MGVSQNQGAKTDPNTSILYTRTPKLEPLVLGNSHIVPTLMRAASGTCSLHSFARRREVSKMQAVS